MKLEIKPTGKKRKKLMVQVTYAPTGGTPASKSLVVKLKLAR